jgi:hypothetical protein
VVATLSPRGFHPLLASSEREVLSQIRAYPGTLRLAVVDATLPDYAFIARALKDTLPIGSIIVLKGSHRSQDIGQCCWTGCEFLKSKSTGHAWFSARSAKPAAGGTDSLSSRCGRPPRWHGRALFRGAQPAYDWAASGDLNSYRY